MKFLSQEPAATQREPEEAPPPAPRPQAAESRAFRPSTFADRKREAAELRERHQVPERQLVSLGVVQRWALDHKGKQFQQEIELLHEYGRPSRLYYRGLGLGSPVVPVVNDTRRDEIESVGVMPRTGRNRFGRKPGGDDSPPPSPGARGRY